MNSQSNIINALAFAAERHKNQVRKGAGKIPYINHPICVVKILSECGEND